MQVVNCTNPAQYFHVMRRQMRRNFRSPMVIFTPKSLLRAPRAVSTTEDLATGSFQTVIDDVVAGASPERAKRLLFCSGKIYYDLIAARDERVAASRIREEEVAIVRVEQLYPWDFDAVDTLLKRYARVEHIAWVQEEPANMGPWPVVRDYLTPQVGGRLPVEYAGRLPSAAPAGGSMRLHRKRQERLIAIAFGEHSG